MRRRSCSQLNFLGHGRHGGFRDGAGRKRSRESGERHAVRAGVSARAPVHCTARVREGLPSLRLPSGREIVARAFVGAQAKVEGFRICEFSVQGNHLHLLIEAGDRGRPARGMRNLLGRIAKALNQLVGESGAVFTDRYHLHVLRTPREVRNALRYVLHNGWKHGVLRGEARPDPCSSAPWFSGWNDAPERALSWFERSIVQPARSLALRIRWRQYGLLSIVDTPAQTHRR
jgi:REP element-mobilizing transposase RayT